MGSSTGNILTLANSIIGVSVLAMPYCFKQCGILLSALSLIFSNLLTRLACYYLMKSAIMERMKNFEMLAFRAFGPHGKLTVEICIIGFMLGTCVAYFVIIGDLGPTIIGPALGLEHVSALRPSVLIGVAIFVVLPLGLKRNVDSLNGLSAASIAFYLVLVLKVMAESAGNFVEGTWTDKVIWWRPAGLLQCLPIFSMALSCQTQLFEIFGSLPNTPLDRANAVVKSAVNLTTLFYLSVGFFGYVAYCTQNFTGNLLLNFSSTISSELIKMGFILTMAVSFPLVIFPCRASIYSLLYSKSVIHTHHSHSHEPLGSAYIPETQFQCITLLIVTCSLIIGILIPNIEIVLGLVGSTIGVFVCLITPGLIFNSLSSKKNNERLLAQFLIGLGLVIMVLGTYANLYATEETLSALDVDKFQPIVSQKEKAHIPILNVKDLIKDEEDTRKKKIEKELFKKKIDEVVKKEVAAEKPIEVQKTPEIEVGKGGPKIQALKASPVKNPERSDPVIPDLKFKGVAQKPPAPQPKEMKVQQEEPKNSDLLFEANLSPIDSKVQPEQMLPSEQKLKIQNPEVAKSEPRDDSGRRLVAHDDSDKDVDAKIIELSPKLSNESKLTPQKNISSKLSQKMVENVPLPLALAQIEDMVKEESKINKNMVQPPLPLAQDLDKEQPKLDAALEQPVQAKPEAPHSQSKTMNEPPIASKSKKSSLQSPPQPPAVDDNDNHLETREKRDTDACDKNESDDNKVESVPDRGLLPSTVTIIKTPRTLSNGDQPDLVIDPELVEKKLIEAAADVSSRLQSPAMVVSLDQPHKRDLKSLEKQQN